MCKFKNKCTSTICEECLCLNCEVECEWEVSCPISLPSENIVYKNEIKIF